MTSGDAPPPPEQHIGAAEPPKSGDFSHQDGPSITSEANAAHASTSPLCSISLEFWSLKKPNCGILELFLPILQQEVPGDNMSQVSILHLNQIKASGLIIGLMLGLFIITFMLMFAQHSELSKDSLSAKHV